VPCLVGSPSLLRHGREFVEKRKINSTKLNASSSRADVVIERSRMASADFAGESNRNHGCKSFELHMGRSRDFSISEKSFISQYNCRRPIDWTGCFANGQPLEIEIGSGLGETLLRNAQVNPGRNYIGIERDWKRVKRTLRKIKSIGNIRVLQMDAHVALLRLVEEKTINRIYSLFPCPWPKKGHEKHRLFSSEYLRLMNSRLTDGGSAQVVTDYLPFFHWACEQVPGTGFGMEKEVIPPQFDTKFERKWCATGQKEFYQLTLLKKEHVAIPLEEDQELKAYFLDNFLPESFTCRDITGETSIIFKDFIFDNKREKGMIHLVVSEPDITQHLWTIIVKGKERWCLAKAEGHTVLPTKGVARAIKHVAEEIKRAQEEQTA